jgi:predicted P-loop ATPase
MDWTPVDDRSLKGMTMKVRLSGIDARDNDVRRYVQSNMIRLYDPISDYLWDKFDKWDGKDHIRKLARTVPTKNPHWENWFYTWFLGMVHQWQVGSHAKYGNQAVPLLISMQGYNKSTFCEQLLPPELSFGYTGNLQIDDKKQVLQQMAQMLLINLDEFNQISPKTQQGFLKNIITLSSVKIKRPYGRHVEDFPRRVSFIATTNQPDVLADPSGSRRFLGVELTGPIDVSTPPNYEQLYAQAMQALHRHESYYFGPAEIQQITESNRKFSLRTATEQFFLAYFEPAKDTKEGTWMSAAAILDYLKDKVGVSLLKPLNVIAFGRALSAIPELQKHVTSTTTNYLVVKKQEK